MWKSIFFRFCCSVSCFIYRVLAEFLIFALVLLSFFGIANAQHPSSVLEPLSAPKIGEYRSTKDGDWTDFATWQEWTGIEWLPASTFPSESSRRTPIVAGWNTSIKTEGGNIHEIALPEGIEAGDLLLIFWTGAQTGGAIATLPSGFTRLYSATSSLRDRITWYKVANGTEGQTINIRAGTGASAHIAYRIAAGTYDGIPVAIKSPITGSSSTPDPPTLNPNFGAVPTLWIAASHSDGDISTAAPLGYHVPIIAYTGNEGNEGARTATAHIITTNAASQDPAAFSLDSDRNWAANTIAIQGASRKAIIQNNHTVKLSNNLIVSDVDVYGALDINTNTAMSIHAYSTLTIRAGGRLRLPGNNAMKNDARIEGAGNFMLSEGGYLEIGSINGITSSGTTESYGNIRNDNSGIRTFHPGAHYIYNRNSFARNDQCTGNGYPNNLTGSLTIDNPGTVTRTTSANRTITTGTLYLLQGTFAAGASGFSMGNNTSSPNGTIVRRGGILTGRVGSNWYSIVYEGDSKTTGPELLGDGLRNLTIDLVDRTQILTLNQNTTVPDTLTLKTGLVNTGSNILTLSSNVASAISGGSSNSFVQGTLVRGIARGADTYTFPLGSDGRYAPAILDFTANNMVRDVTGSTENSNHVDIAYSHLKDAKVARQWAFLATGTGTYNYNATFSWDNADEEDGFDFKGAILSRYNGSTWTYPTISDKTVSSVTATGLTELGDFQVGNEDMRPDAGKSTIEADRTSDVVANNIDMSTITLTVYNANGNPVSAGVDVFLKVTSGSLGDGGLDPFGSWKTNEDGQVVVNLTSTLANSVGVMAYLGTDTTGELIGGTEMDAVVEVTFKAGEATHLAIAKQPIVGGASGSALIGQPEICILDANDNIVIDDSATEVTVTIFSGDGGSLSGMHTIIADGGVVRFYDLALSGIFGETYRLNFSSDGLAMAVSDDVILSSHGSVGQVVLSGSTADLPSGDSRVLTVTLKDVAGNIVDTGEESFFEVVFSQNGGSGSVSGLTAITGEDGIAIITLIGEKAGQVNVRVSTVSLALVDELSFTIIVDKSVLQAAIDATIDLVETDWSVDSWEVLQNAITEVQSILDNTATTQLEIDVALTNLEDALSALGVDKSTLSTVIAEAITKIKGDWFPASWGVFATALANAEGVLADVESAQLEVDIALATLNTALAALTVDRTALHLAVTKTEDLVETDWSVDNWSVLQNVITEAKSILDNTAATQLEIDTVFAILNAAIAGLESVVSNITGIKDDLPNLETVYGIAFEEIDNLKDLPLSLMVSLSSGDSELVEVKWEAGDYNPVVLGEYTILGKLVLPAEPAFGNVNDLMAEVKVIVNPKPLTVTADNKSRVYGRVDPALTYTLSTSLIGDDAFTGALARTAGENVGEYAIGQGTLALNDNYDLTFIPGSLTIQKADQRIQFKEVGKLLRDVGQVELEISSDSDLPVGLHSSDELVATIVGRDLLVHRLGTTRITATQEGDKNHEPADPVTITVTVEDATGGDPVRIHPALSPNGDGINDFLILEGIKDYPENKLTILTRNGLRVFTIDNYDNESRVFKGTGNFNSAGGTLPQGTYFYVLEYKDGGSWKVKKGWLVLKM